LAAGEYKDGRQQQAHSNKESDCDQDTGKVLRASSESELRRTSASYPSDVYKNDQNLAVLKSKELDDERFQNLLDEIEVLLNDGQEGLEGRIEAFKPGGCWTVGKHSFATWGAETETEP
jgi:hypothetical protein